ncbi:MAG: amidohydrolase family protein [Planctomycetota bacterium]|nr:amidohydrolase family protein [Planctomycetota bacterium]
MGAWLLTGVKRYPGDSGNRYDLRIDDDLVTSWSVAGDGDSGGAQVLDLADCWVLPGFVDSHLHLLYSMDHLSQHDLAGLSVDSIASTITEKINGPRIGHGWKDPLPALMNPDPRRYLDSIVSDDPVFLWNSDHHRALVNSAALQIARVDPRDHAGIVVEEDAEKIWARIPRDRNQDAAAACSWLLAHGITAATTFDRSGSIKILGEASAEGQLGVRIRHGYPEDEFLLAIESGQACRPVGDRTDCFAMPWIKIFLDGTLGSRTAWLKADYCDDPGNRGVMRKAPQDLDHLANLAAQYGWALAIHAIGDAAVEEAIRAISITRSKRPDDLPDRIEHCQLIDPPDLDKMRSSGAVASMQPCHLYQDREILGERWGNRSGGAFALRSIDDAGIPIILGTDAPIECVDPWCDLDAAVQRLDREGLGSIFGPQQRVAFESAFSWRTAGAAKGNFLPEGWGTLEPGTAADLQILSAKQPQQIRSIDEASLQDVYSLGAWRLGRFGAADES